MELYKLSNEDLIKLCELQEKITDCIFPDILSLINLPFTTDKNNAEKGENQEPQPVIIPQIELISYYINPIFEMENEMKNRGILEEYRKSHPYIDFENAELLLYHSFSDRVGHLFNLYERGFLSKDNIERILDRMSVMNRTHSSLVS